MTLTISVRDGHLRHHRGCVSQSDREIRIAISIEVREDGAEAGPGGREGRRHDEVSRAVVREKLDAGGEWDTTDEVQVVPSGQEIAVPVVVHVPGNHPAR